jgi:Predicted metal-binding integral membrane protein (DUF2182)
MSSSRRAPAETTDVARLLPLTRETAWRHPEWWSLAASAMAWVLILARARSGAMGAGSAHSHYHGGTAVLPLVGEASVWRMEALDWLLMVVAMMLPMVVDPIRTTATRSLWARRHRAIGGFLIGYVTPWALLGLLVSGLIAALGVGGWLRLPAAAIGFALAAAWQVTAIKRRAVLWCHRTTPLAPSGWRADRDCLRYGWMIGWRCLVSCWAMMVACVLAGHGILAMACAAVVGVAERQLPRADRRLATAAIAGLALMYATAAMW